MKVQIASRNTSWSYDIQSYAYFAHIFSGGNIAAAWAALKAMGEDGYLNTARSIMETTIKLKENIQKIQVVVICH